MWSQPNHLCILYISGRNGSKNQIPAWLIFNDAAIMSIGLEYFIFEQN